MDELIFNRDFIGLVFSNQLLHCIKNMGQSNGHGRFRRSLDDTVADPAQPSALMFDDAPTRGVQTGINAQNTNR